MKKAKDSPLCLCVEWSPTLLGTLESQTLPCSIPHESTLTKPGKRQVSRLWFRQDEGAAQMDLDSLAIM